MDIRSSVDGLKTLLGVPLTAPAQTQPVKNEASSIADPSAGDQATLSSAGSEISEAASGSDVRMEKVSAIQAAIAGGTYNVPASAVAGKVVDSMLSRGQSSGE
jgi:flagellar biosynthesis anti-sigma factor FlgM